MKRNKSKLLAILLAVVAVLIAACELVIEEINFPEDAQANSDITFTVKLKVVTTTDDKNTNLVFALLTPKLWDLKNNASISYSTIDYAKQGFAEIVDEKMILIPDSENERSTAMPYPRAYQMKIGLGGNTGPVEWTVYKSTSKLTINDQVSKEPIYAIVTVKLRTGVDPIKFFLGVGFCGSNWGLTPESDEGRYAPNETFVPVTVYGDGPMLDYTVIPTVTTTPSTYRYGDIFAVNFDASQTELKNAKSVVMLAKAVLANGTVTGTATCKMNPTAYDSSWTKYIYPKSLFNLSQETEIEEIYVWFANEDQSIVYKEGEEGKLLGQAKQ